MLNMSGSVKWTFSVSVRKFALIGLLFVGWTSVAALSNQLPCKFLDSVNITNGEYLSNKSIIFDGVEFKQDDYARIDYVLTRESLTVSVEPHIRGCLCNHQPCIRLCCPLGTLPERKNNATTCTPHAAAKYLEREILDSNNATTIAKIDQHFSIVNDYPCKQAFIADTDFQITHTGNIMHEASLLAHHEYCIRAVLDNTTNTVDWTLVVCFTPEDETTIRFSILPICMMISVLFIIATLTVYMCVPKLRNLQGKCIMYHLAFLAIGYSLLSYLQFNGSNYVEPLFCILIAYILYVSFLSALLWLNVVNFDLWLNFQSSSGFNSFSERKRFSLYTLYSFGISCFLTLVIFMVDHFEPIPYYLRPRMGYNTCFFHNDWLTRFVYFYLPLGVIIIVNIVLFVSTAKRIRQMRLSVIEMRSKDDSSKLQRTINRMKENVTLYMRLFLIAGLAWALEIISFLVSEDSLIFLGSDIWNCLQGILLFILLICRRRVLLLIKERWNNLRGKTNSNESAAINSYSSGYYLPLNSMSAPK